MAAAALALAVLVVRCRWRFCVWGSLSGDGQLTLEHFREALSNRLYVTALRNSLVLGAWTAVPEHCHRPAAGLGGESHRRAGPPLRARHRPRRVPDAAVPDRHRAS